MNYTLKKLTLFDIYEGDTIGSNFKSLAYSLLYQSNKKTLKDNEIDLKRAKAAIDRARSRLKISSRI